MLREHVLLSKTGLPRNRITRVNMTIRVRKTPGCYFQTGLSVRAAPQPGHTSALPSVGLPQVGQTESAPSDCLCGIATRFSSSTSRFLPSFLSLRENILYP